MKCLGGPNDLIWCVSGRAAFPWIQLSLFRFATCFFPRASYNWFAFFRPAYTAFQPFRDKILTYVEQQYVEELFYMPCWFSDVLCIAVARSLGSIIRGSLTLVLVVWASGSHLDNDHFVITHCKTLSDLNVALGHIYSLPEGDFSLSSSYLWAERICCRKLCKQILLQLPALLKSFIWNCLIALCIFVWNRCCLERAGAVWPCLSWCLPVNIFSHVEKKRFLWGWSFPEGEPPLSAQD